MAFFHPQTFQWKQTTNLLDGTRVVLETIPCQAGEAEDICLVEVIESNGVALMKR